MEAQGQACCRILAAEFRARSTGRGRYNGRITSYRQPVLIYNPTAGKIRRNPHWILQRATAALERAGIVGLRIIPTDEAGHATELAQAAVAEGADLVLVLGGDGTINEVVNGLAHSDVPLGVLPGGTANVLATELGLGSRIEKAAARLGKSIPRTVALGRVTSGEAPRASRYFLMMCGAGLDARVVYDIDHRFKAAAGKLAYWWTGLAQITHRVETLDVRINGSSYRCGYALVSRVRNYGGDLEIARGASLLKDAFEIVTFEGTNPLRYAWYLLGVLSRREKSMSGVRVVSSGCAEVLSATHVQFDGEYLGCQPVSIEIVPGALNLLVPPQYG
jgi:diacylglycerol kinase (ATP)